jgi:protocatechuate 3,4-dioxygenase beta subunit
VPSGFNCTLSPETTEGPYFVDERLDRPDVTAGQEGVPLTLAITVHEVGSPPEPCVGAQVDIWQANALGLYSAVPDQPRGDTGGETFLRGYQLTDQEGAVQFRTIYPGWYEGRALHIHVKVRDFSSGSPSETFTTQVFFDESVNDAVMAMTPYNERPDRDTTNDQDTIFHPELIAATEGDPESGLRAEFRIRLLREGRAVNAAVE